MFHDIVNAFGNVSIKKKKQKESKEHFHRLSKTAIKISEAFYTMK